MTYRTVSEISAITGVPNSTLKNWCRDGSINGRQEMTGKPWTIDDNDPKILELIKRHDEETQKNDSAAIQKYLDIIETKSQIIDEQRAQIQEQHERINDLNDRIKEQREREREQQAIITQLNNTITELIKRQPIQETPSKHSGKQIEQQEPSTHKPQKNINEDGIRSAIQAGKSIKEIAQEFSVSVDTVRRRKHKIESGN